MRRPNHLIALALLALTASWGLAACGGTNCGDGTQENQEGMCVPVEELSCADGTTKVDGKCVADDWCAEGTKREGNRCVPDVQKVCESMGGAVKVENGTCTIAEAACGAGTSLSANGNCVVAQGACGDGLALADSGRCTPTGEVCQKGTLFDEDQGLCLPEATCQMGDVILNGVCASPAEELAANADHAESENNDPMMGGMANTIPVKMPGKTTAFTGSINAPRDIDGDGTADQDRDVFGFSASTGDWFKVSVQSTGLDSPFVMISGPDGYERWAATASTSGLARFFVAPKDGDYSITVMPKELVFSSDIGPIGSSDSSYVGSLERLQTPMPSAKDMSMDDQALTGSASDLTDNLFDLQNLTQSDIYELKTRAAAADADLVLQIWSDPTTPEMTIDPLDPGTSTRLSSIKSGNRLVLIDWKKAWGPSLAFDISANRIGSASNPTISAGMTNTQMVTVPPFTTLEVEQRNMGGEDLDIEIIDSLGNSLDAETVASGDRLATVVKEPGTYTVEVTNNTMNSLSPELKVFQFRPVDLGRLSTNSTSTARIGGLDSGDMFAVEFETEQDHIGGIFFDADDGYESLTAEIFDSSANSVQPATDLDALSDATGLDEEAAGVFVHAARTKTYYATFETNGGEAKDVQIQGRANMPVDIGSVMKGDSKTTSFNSKIANYMSSFAKVSTSSKLGLSATGKPSASNPSSLILRDQYFNVVARDVDAKNPTISQEPIASGTSFIQIRADEGDLQAGYKVDAEFVTAPVQESEPNDTEVDAQPMTFGAKHNANIQQGDTDYWKIDLQSALRTDETLLLQASGPSNYNDWSCELFNGSSTSLQSQTDKDYGCALVAGGLSAGTYYLKVTMDDSTNEDYNLFVERAIGTKEAEPNNTAGAANHRAYADWTSGEPFYGENDQPSDSADFFEFTLSSALGAAERLIIVPEYLGPDPSTLTFELQDASKNAIQTANGPLSASGLSAGSHYLKVSGASSTTDGQYKISARTYSPDQRFSVAPGTTIPADAAQPVNSIVMASNCSTVTDVTVDVDISHDQRGHVRIALENPNGTTVVLKGIQSSDWDDDLQVNIPLSRPSAESLSAFNGPSGNGQWTLTVSDEENSLFSSTGTLNSWALNLKCM